MKKKDIWRNGPTHVERKTKGNTYYLLNEQINTVIYLDTGNI